MAQWFVKDLSKLTGVSVQTLHHYDRIDLLKPSLRLPNGYRLYSEKDLLRLQQIISLKFFGFELAQIKILLASSAGTIEQFSAQAKLLEEKALAMLDASQALKQIASDTTNNKSIPWKTIIQLIEVYRMTQKLRDTWVNEIFTADELKQYAAFEAGWKSNFSPEKQVKLNQAWSQLVAEMKQQLDTNPHSDIGISLGKKCMDWLNEVYGKKYAHLRTKKFEQGFVEGKGLDEAGLTPEIVIWMDKAIDAYWQSRIHGVLNQIGSGVSDEDIFQQWKQILDEIYGEDNARKKEIYERALASDEVSQQAKEWLKILKELTFVNQHLL